MTIVTEKAGKPCLYGRKEKEMSKFLCDTLKRKEKKIVLGEGKIQSKRKILSDTEKEKQGKVT